MTELGATVEVPIRGMAEFFVAASPGQFYRGSVQLIADGPILPMGQIITDDNSDPDNKTSTITTMTFYPVKEKL